MNSILLTGASGFLGQHFYTNLQEKFNLKTLGRENCNHYPIDLSTGQPIFREAFDGVIHNAGKAHIVPRTQEEAEGFFKVNVEGTKNLLVALEKTAALPHLFIFISTVAVYGLDAGENIPETAPLNGQSPYAKSKIMAEQAVEEWCKKNSVRYIILRLPLVVGEHPPGNLGAIYKAIKNRKYLRISDNKARKSVVLAEDIAKLIPRLEGKQGIFNLTDGEHPSFGDIEQALERGTGQKIRYSLPSSVLHGFGLVGNLMQAVNLPTPITSDTIKKMTSTLTFNDDKARKELGWTPQPVLPWIESHLH